MNSLLLICTFQAMFLSLLVFLKKKKVHSDNFLAAWLLVISIHIFLEFLQLYNYQHNFPYPWLIGLDISFSMLHPIMIYLYILSYTRMARSRTTYLLHFMPFIVINIIMIPVYYAQSPAMKIADYTSVMSGNGFLIGSLKPVTYFIMLVVIVYLIVSLILLERHRKNLRAQLSSVKGFELRWLQTLLFILGVVMILAIVVEILSNTFLMISPSTGMIVVFVLITAGIFYIGIHGILQTDYFSGYNPDLSRTYKEDSHITAQKSQEKVDDEQRDEQITAHYDRLINFMESEKPYLESNVHLQALADMVDMKPHYLSMLINQKSGRNFFDFINFFRIKEFKAQAKEPSNRNYTLLSIAYSCGFNSKTAFNRAFKNQTGITPSEYHRQLTENLNL